MRSLTEVGNYKEQSRAEEYNNGNKKKYSEGIHRLEGIHTLEGMPQRNRITS